MALFGILNITADSFSDGGKFLDPQAAIAQGRALAEAGADVLDLGGASSNPDSEAVAPALEIARLAPAVAAFKRDGIKLSIDSFSAETQRWAMAQDVDYLNDIQGFPFADLYPELAASRALLIVMHAVQGRGRADRTEISAEDIFDRIVAFFDDRIAALTAGGIARERLILDPGMGFFLGGNAQASITVLRRLDELKRIFDLPLLVSVSRKSFLRRITNKDSAAGPATLAAELFAFRHGAHHIRTHDPGALRDALAVTAALDGNTP